MPDSRISAFSLVGTPSTSTELVANEPGSGTRKLTLGQAMTFLQTARGMPFVKALASTVNSTSTTPAKVTGLDLNPGAGTFIFEYYIRWQAATATTGIKFDCNHNGTVTSFVWQQRYVDVSATAATATPSQSNVQAAAAVQGAFSSRAKGTAGRGVLLSADVAASDMLTIIEGIAVVSAAGNFELWHGAEVAAAGNVSVMAGSALRLTQVA